ncbi:cytochrome c-type biogenesis protein [Rhodoplanes sp. Z2-YC6860]|uniref:cytochrome c-type biogenesis protein n=1 Tax=Rhodoplanes sp. Z2-YC6860 TaxID=674703 RepID=UPI00078E0180|nr:cytochrome c-type biogenesis protein [Rhodoplanes sp. Z2-YC6860]AMN41436.1 cytochrome c-type biogenesis protein CcmH [Rhodoplanes sp. Z2-YC6860]
MRAAARTFLGLLVAASCLIASPAFAVQPDEILPDKALETRARDLSRELRCMVCQNQSIDDSDAPLARDLRLLVRERLKAGDSDQQVLDFLTDRYGQFVLLRPRFGWDTAILWLAPAAVLLLGGLALVSFKRRRDRNPIAVGEKPLTDAERTRLAALLEQGRPSTPNSQ